jgi:hypothetical protein
VSEVRHTWWGPVVDVPVSAEWVTARAAMMAARSSYPRARLAMAERLSELGDRRARSEEAGQG